MSKSAYRQGNRSIRVISDRLRYLGGSLPRTTNGRMEIGLCWTEGSRVLLTARVPKGFYAGLHAEKTSGLI